MVFQYLTWYVQAFVAAAPALLLRLVAAWLIAFVILVYSFRFLKPRVRARAVKIDEKASGWARGLRYREHHERRDERLWLTWFFRFWTNFASSPSLIVLSFFIPLWFVSLRAYPVNGDASGEPATVEQIIRFTLSNHVELWMLPGLCFAGALLLSFILKRVFRRLRPPRPDGSFGHKLKDPSFPSGHSLTSLCFWGMLAVSTCAALSVTIWTVLFALLAVTIVLLTGASRIYLGVHFASDVLGGFTIGLVWCTICYLLLRGSFAAPTSY